MKQNNKQRIGKLKIPSFRNLIFYIVIAGFSWVLYGNTVRNYYNFDDYRVIENNAQASRGISAIPEIFTTLYADESGLKFGYRPLVRASFAIDYQLFGKARTSNNSPVLPYASHAMNVLYYMVALLLLFTMLRKVFRKYNPFFPFLVVLLYMAHPLHTEVVASLKSRDEILNLVFCCLAMLQFLRWADSGKWPNLLLGAIFYILAILSKPTALAFLLIFPLTLCFFTPIPPRRLIPFTIAVFIVALLASAGPFLFLPDFNRTIWFIENPLVNESFISQVATGFYVLLLYLKKLIFPVPLLFYYGYNMVPVKGFNDWSVILAILVYAGMFVFALWKIKKKHIISYIILFFLVSIAMFSNIIQPVPGIIADRLMFIPAIGFSMFVVWLLFWIFRAGIDNESIKTKSIVPVIVIVAFILVPFTSITTERNKDWRTKIDLYEHDLKELDNSVKAHDMYASEIIRQVTALIQSEPINVTKFQMPAIRKAIKHYKRALEIYPGHYSSWYNLGFIYSEFLNEYSRAVSYLKKSLAEDALKEEPYYNRALYYLGRTYERMGIPDSAVYFYREAYLLNPNDIRSMAAEINVVFKEGNKEKGIELAKRVKNKFPDSELPDLHLGVYYRETHDTLNAVNCFRRVLETGKYPSINVVLYNYYRNESDWVKANFFFTQAREEMRRMGGQQNTSE